MPDRCPICEDERQWVPDGGHRWVTLEELRDGHRNVLTELEPGLTAIRTEPKFAIGQRAILVQTPAGNLLWDCVSLVDAATVAEVEALGGLAGIAVSHPHFYGSCVEWSDAFGGVPIWLHADDAEWVQRSSPAIEAWTGDSAEPVPGVTLRRIGGHFAGAAVCHRGDVLLSGDTFAVVSDRRYVSIMWSYPNLIPVPASVALEAARRMEGLEFERVYSAFPVPPVATDGAAAVRRSMERYVERVSERRTPN